MLLTEQLLSVNLHASLQYELACVGCRKGFGARQMAAILDKLMRTLGYPKYFCQGEVSFQQLPIQLSSCRSTLLHHVLGTSMPSSGGLSKPSHDCGCPRTLRASSYSHDGPASAQLMPAFLWPSQCNTCRPGLC